jgi:hypothetical protein
VEHLFKIAIPLGGLTAANDDDTSPEAAVLKVDIPSRPEGQPRKGKSELQSVPYTRQGQHRDLRLPFRVAGKAEQQLSADDGPAKQEVHKFEWFILTALEISSKTTIIEVKSIEEFAPVKNAPG